MRTLLVLLAAWLMLLTADTAIKNFSNHKMEWWHRKRAFILLGFILNAFFTDHGFQRLTDEYSRSKLNSVIIAATIRAMIITGLVTNSASHLITSYSQFINDLAKLGFIFLGYTQMLGMSFAGFYLMTKLRILSPSPKLELWALLLGTQLTIYGVYNCVSDWQITEISVKMRNFTSKDNFNIIFVSDIHIGGAIGERNVASLVAKINTLEPSVVLLGGDLLDLSVEKGALALSHLRKLTPKSGVYFVPGNHDYKHSISDLTRELSTLGVRSLMNENVRITDTSGEGWFYLAGIEDRNTDLAQALKRHEKNRETILLAHRPASAKLAIAQYKDLNLILCGHTHGGESFPVNLLVYLTSPYFAGMYPCDDVTGCRVFVSVGAMYFNIPIRHLFKREIVVISVVYVDG